LAVPLVAAGNSAARDEVVTVLQQAGKEVREVDNVMPKAGVLAVESAREAIREIFMARITHAKGLDGLAGIVPVVLPTPMAVLRGVRIGADGAANEKGWGDMLVVDVGGATTDVHSIGYGQPQGENVIAQGLAESYAKRTVEGDLGIRFNAATIVGRVGVDKLIDDLRQNFPDFSVEARQLSDYVEQITQETGTVPLERWHVAADAVLANNAVTLAVERHVGRRERIVAREGEAWVHSGKDMRDTRTLIGTGGVFVHNPHAAYILAQRPSADSHGAQALRPRDPQIYLDSSYLLYAVGLLSETLPQVALRLFQRYMAPVARRDC
ncbi:MAG TPA: glutamate mutase L, partial [Candidatus Binatia bacterium]|nr:glutamate mutase L [Candidatus Binatia bacterium]